MRKNRQPLSFQIETESCWITSVLNGLLFLFGNLGKFQIKNEVSRILYSICLDGTDDRDAKLAIKFLQAMVPVKCSIYMAHQITENLLKRRLRKGACIVADVQSGEHSVLITGFANGKFLLWDCSWGNVNRKRYNGTGIELINNEPLYNVRVPVQKLFSKVTTTKQNPFSMGGIQSRFIVVMSKKSQNN